MREQEDRETTEHGIRSHRSLLSYVSSNDLPGHVTSRPPQSGKLRLRFSFHPVMRCETETTAMLLQCAGYPTVRTFRRAGATLRPHLEVDGNCHPGKRTLGCAARWRDLQRRSTCFHRPRDAQRASVLRRKTHDYLENKTAPPPERRRSTIRSGRVSSRDSPSKNRQ